MYHSTQEKPSTSALHFSSNLSFSYLKRTCEILRDKYDGDVPSTYDDIIALPGVGPKMTHLLLQCAWNKTEGIAVDVHVHRVANRIGWVHNTKTPEHTRKVDDLICY